MFINMYWIDFSPLTQSFTELPTPPAKAQWLLSPSTQQQAPSAETAPDQRPAKGERQQGCAVLSLPDEPEPEPEEGQAQSEIARAMRALEEEAYPRKRTMTRFNFFGGKSVERSDR